jgi:hypothetical protein
MNCVIKLKLNAGLVRYCSRREPAELMRSLGLLGVFARGVSVAGGIVGCADIVFYDSPPLTGWASGASVSFVGFGQYRVTSVTLAQTYGF